MIIDYNKLKELDLVFTTSLYPSSCMIRKVSAGKWFDLNIASHVGILVNIRGKYFIAEMILKKGLQINSLKKYMKPSRFGDRIVCVRRTKFEYSKELAEAIASSIISDYFETLKYDWQGVLSYVFHNVMQVDSMFYCSEYVDYCLFKYLRDHYLLRKITPYELQVSADFKDVDFRMF